MSDEIAKSTEETRHKLPLGAKFMHKLGLSMKIPKPLNPVGSIHFRVPKGVLTQIFYPAISQEIEDKKIRYAYRKEVITGTAKYLKQNPSLWHSFLGAAKHPCEENATPEKGSYPVVFFSPGLIGSADVYCKTCSDLASEGFIVITFEHEDGSGCYAKTANGEEVESYTLMSTDRDEVKRVRGPMLQKRESEIRHLINFFLQAKDEEYPELKGLLGKMKKEEIILAGHSFGAATTVYVARNWPERFKAVILLDIWSFPFDSESGLNNVPMISILSEVFARLPNSRLTSEMIRNSNQVWASLYAKGSVHYSFADTTFYFPKRMAKLIKTRGKKLDPILCQQSTISICKEFLNSVLNSSLNNGSENSNSLSRKNLKEECCIITQPSWHLFNIKLFEL